MWASPGTRRYRSASWLAAMQRIEHNAWLRIRLTCGIHCTIFHKISYATTLTIPLGSGVLILVEAVWTVRNPTFNGRHHKAKLGLRA